MFYVLSIVCYPEFPLGDGQLCKFEQIMKQYSKTGDCFLAFQGLSLSIFQVNSFNHETLLQVR